MVILGLTRYTVAHIKAAIKEIYEHLYEIQQKNEDNLKKHDKLHGQSCHKEDEIKLQSELGSDQPYRAIQTKYTIHELIKQIKMLRLLAIDKEVTEYLFNPENDF